MVRSMTAAVAGLRAHQSKLDVIGNNIANVNTYGYKSARVVFRDAMYQTMSGAGAGDAQYAGTNSKQVGYGSNVGTISTLFVTGSYYPTDYPTDVMINGNGYFILGEKGGTFQDPTDVSNAVLTRVGEFALDREGRYLVDPNGYVVYGYAWDAGATPPDYDYSELVPIEVTVIDPVTNMPVKLDSISVGEDGAVMGVDSDNNDIYLGKIAVAFVDNPSGLDSLSNSYYTSTVNSGTVAAYQPGQGGTGKLMAGGLEMSTVDLSQEMTDMITTQRGFQANSRIITVTDEMLQELVNLKR